MMAGLPASGKSTYAKKLAEEENAIIHSSDELRAELFGTELHNDSNDSNDILFKELHKRIINDLSNGKSVIYDATNINYKRRKAFLDSIKNIECEKICVLIATPYEDCLKYNALRERNVPEEVIKRMYHNFYIPQYYEGWNHIRIIRNSNKEDIHDILEEMFCFNQNNSHHTLSLGDHCVQCLKLIMSNNSIEEEVKDFLTPAAFLHDIGKLKTKSFTNSKGEVTADAHYYQHHLVSAYDAIFYLFNLEGTSDEVLQICNYIQWHMQPYFMKTEKSERKFINLVGQDFYDNLKILHQADKEAH